MNIFNILSILITVNCATVQMSQMSILPEIFGNDCDQQAKAMSVILAVKGNDENIF